MRSSPFILGLGLISLAAACNASPPGSEMNQPDAAPLELPRPQVNTPPATPLDTAPIEGAAPGAARIVIKAEGLATQAGATLGAGGGFCIDAKLKEGRTDFEIFAVADDGLISEPTRVQVDRDPALPRPPGAECSDAPECAAAEICDNGEDDDCDDFEDACDPGCNGCTDDFFEPNDIPYEVPTLGVGTYPNLSICPCHAVEDWFAFHVNTGITLAATAQFSHAQVDIDLQLYTAEEAEKMQNRFLVQSNTLTDTESLSHVTTAAGTYYLRVLAFARSSGTPPRGTYTLTIR